MPNDAKLGLIVGVGVVIAVASVFCRKDAATAQIPQDDIPVAAGQAGDPPAAAAPRAMYRTVQARTANRSQEARTGRRHTVREGETLFSLAQRYYGDTDRFGDIYRVNRQVLKTPDQLPPGTVLTIPDLPDGETLRDGN